MLHSEVPMAETAPRENIPMEKIPEMASLKFLFTGDCYLNCLNKSALIKLILHCIYFLFDHLLP